ncbi:hypothetical protein [Candidatus Halobonum tyrrellensis]|uniref:Uncharacterized protein n=1 Tax=Candidatus Halobonum tyrrellensis G22 TaxID=1324957 RepID=V4GT26_9EURY|nr:hypothetical protein [Candidatus Halobonum tyrrellensis]ESP88256.1 hypothetical protein K933_09846 [Candidatus Halobonum tyrrellensis G22]
MSATLRPVAARLPAAFLQLPAVFDSTVGQVFLALVAFLVVLLVARVAMSVAWKVALIAAVVVGAFLFVTTFLL